MADCTLERLLIWWEGPSVLFFPDLHGAVSVAPSNSLCRVTAVYIYTCISVYMTFICRYTLGGSRFHSILLDTLVTTNKLLKNAILKKTKTNKKKIKIHQAVVSPHIVADLLITLITASVTHQQPRTVQSPGWSA